MDQDKSAASALPLDLGQAPMPAAGLIQPLVADLIKETTTAKFAADVVQESRKQPVLVDFWAPWCGPCKQLTPVLERIVTEARGQVKLVKMNIDEHPSIAGQLGIQSIPAVIAFKNGQAVDGFMGAVPESQIRDFIRKLGGGPDAQADVAAALAAAAQALEAGDREMAAQIYDSILAEMPETLGAIAGLASLFVDAGDLDQARDILETAPADKANAPAIASVRARIALAEEAAELGDAAQFERRLAADPADHASRFELAVIRNAEGDRTAAADNLLAILKADRDWNEGAARAQLLRFFEAWGMTDPSTLAARRKLSSLLFS